MEHKTNTPKLTKKSIANITKQIATKFTDLDEFYLYIHILAYVSGLDKPGYIYQWDSVVNLLTLDENTIQKIKEVFPIQIKQISEQEKKILCKYYLDLCLKYKKDIASPRESYEDLCERQIDNYFQNKPPVLTSYLYKKLIKLIKPENNQIIYDPNCGNGSILVELLKNYSHLNLTIYGDVRNPIEWFLCHINLYVHGAFDDNDFTFEIKGGGNHNELIRERMKDGYDYPTMVFSIIPFNKKSGESERNSDVYPLTHSLKTNEYSYIERMLKTTDGKTIAVVPDSILFDSDSKFVREAYLASDLIEEVISLSESVFDENASIVVFNKNKATDFFRKNEADIVTNPHKALDYRFITFRNDILEEKVETSVVKSKNNADLRVSSNSIKFEKTILEKAREDIRQTEYDVIATISHNLSQKLGKIGDDYNTLIRRLERGKSTSPQTFYKLFGNKESFDRVVNRLKQNVEDASDTMATTVRILQYDKVNLESIDIPKFFRDEIRDNYSGNNYTIRIETKLKSLSVLIDKDALKDAIRNLIENASKHGFEDKERNFSIVFEISKHIESDGIEYASIIYKNDGKPFPKVFSFDEFKRLGSRAGETRGTGLGGFWINKVIELHKGKFNFIQIDESSLSDYKVKFQILLPVES